MAIQLKLKKEKFITSFLAFLFLTSFNTVFAETIPAPAIDFFVTDDISIAKKNLEKFPEFPEAHFNLAVAYSRTAELEKVWSELEETKALIKKKSKDYASRVLLVEKYIALLKKKETDLRFAYRLAFLHYLKGYLLHRLKEKSIDKDIQEFKAQIQAEKLKGDIENNKKIPILRAEKKKLRAQKELLDDKKTNEFILEINRAIAYLDSILLRNPKDIWSMSYKGFMVFERDQDITEAKKIWDKAISLDTENPAPHYLLGKAYMESGNPEKGLGEVTLAMLMRAKLPRGELLNSSKITK